MDFMCKYAYVPCMYSALRGPWLCISVWVLGTEPRDFNFPLYTVETCCHSDPVACSLIVLFVCTCKFACYPAHVWVNLGSHLGHHTWLQAAWLQTA